MALYLSLILLRSVDGAVKGRGPGTPGAPLLGPALREPCDPAPAHGPPQRPPAGLRQGFLRGQSSQPGQAREPLPRGYRGSFLAKLWTTTIWVKDKDDNVADKKRRELEIFT